MIDWQIQISENFPADWDQHRDGCWFPDFAYQEYMLPNYDVGSEKIELYEDTHFHFADMEKLKDNLVRFVNAFRDPPRVFSLPPHTGYGADEFSPQSSVMLPLVQKTIDMIDVAIKLNGELLFRGD